jgi:hypothetical protein
VYQLKKDENVHISIKEEKDKKKAVRERYHDYMFMKYYFLETPNHIWFVSGLINCTSLIFLTIYRGSS